MRTRKALGLSSLFEKNLNFYTDSNDFPEETAWLTRFPLTGDLQLAISNETLARVPESANQPTCRRGADDMDSSYPTHLRIWENQSHTTAEDLFGPPGVGLVSPFSLFTETPNPHDIANQLFACEALKTSLNHKQDEGEPYTLQWFLNIENQRHGRQGRWIPKVLEFAKHPGETLLGLGHGLGTDWLQFARNGASVVVCSSCTSQLDLIRRNFQLRGLEGRFYHALPTTLPLENSSIDVACISGLLQQVSNPEVVIQEVFRVLKPGGKVIALTLAKYDVDYFHRIFFFWHRWIWGKRQRPEKGTRFSGRRLTKLFRQFEEHRIHKRQLRRSEVPHLWRVVPLPLLQRLIGRVLILKAFKPVSTAFPSQAAA